MSVYVTLWSLFNEPNLTSQFWKVEEVYTNLVDLMTTYILTDDPRQVIEFLVTYELTPNFIRTCIQDKQFKFLVKSKASWRKNRLKS